MKNDSQKSTTQQSHVTAASTHKVQAGLKTVQQQIRTALRAGQCRRKFCI